MWSYRTAANPPREAMGLEGRSGMPAATAGAVPPRRQARPVVGVLVLALVTATVAFSTIVGHAASLGLHQPRKILAIAEPVVIPTPTPFLLTVTVVRDGTTPSAGSVTSSPAGISCAIAADGTVTGTCSHSFTAGSHVTLDASPDPADGSVSWSGGCTGTSSCVPLLTAPRSVTATFAGVTP